MSQQQNLFDLTGKRALVTGAGRGIGLALAEGLASAGAQIVLNGRAAGRLEAARGQIEGADLLVFDVTDHDAARREIDRYEAERGAIDIVVNNAGIQHRARLDQFPQDAFQSVLQTNIASVFNVSQAAARHMIARGRGKIISIASVASLLARPTVAPYTASKGAVSNLTKGMAADWARLGLQCNAIAPGYFETEMNEALSSDPAFTEWLFARTPAGRWGRVEELIGACIFLASDASSFVNGQTIYVDGGMTATV